MNPYILSAFIYKKIFTDQLKIIDLWLAKCQDDFINTFGDSAQDERRKIFLVFFIFYFILLFFIFCLHPQTLKTFLFSKWNSIFHSCTYEVKNLSSIVHQITFIDYQIACTLGFLFFYSFQTCFCCFIYGIYYFFIII